ncbi:MAG: hypothetical protein AAGG01_06715, partial [Planctomycetota bacterium]
MLWRTGVGAPGSDRDEDVGFAAEASLGWEEVDDLVRREVEARNPTSSSRSEPGAPTPVRQSIDSGEV